MQAATGRSDGGEPVINLGAALFLGSIYIDRGPLNETRPSSSVDAEPPRPLKGISSWFDRGPRPGAIRTATMQASTQAIEPS